MKALLLLPMLGLSVGTPPPRPLPTEDPVPAEVQGPTGARLPATARRRPTVLVRGARVMATVPTPSGVSPGRARSLP